MLTYLAIMSLGIVGIGVTFVGILYLYCCIGAWLEEKIDKK